MKKGLVVILGLIILIVSSNVMAFQSQITVDTGIPSKEIIFRAADPDTGKTFEGGEFKEESDKNGKVTFDYNLEPRRIKMSFMARNGESYITFSNGKEVIFINNMTVGGLSIKGIILDEFVSVDLRGVSPSVSINHNESNESADKIKIEAINKTEIVVNTTENDIIAKNDTLNESEQVAELFENTSQINREQDSSITGNVIGTGKNILFSVKTYYVLGAFLILIFGFVLAKKKIKVNGVPKASHPKFRVTKLSEIKDNSENIESEEDRLISAEQKLKEAKAELDAIKNKKDRLKEAQERLERDKEELRRLKGEKKNDDYLGLGKR